MVARQAWPPPPAHHSPHPGDTHGHMTVQRHMLTTLT